MKFLKLKNELIAVDNIQRVSAVGDGTKTKIQFRDGSHRDFLVEYPEIVRALIDEGDVCDLEDLVRGE